MAGIFVCLLLGYSSYAQVDKNIFKFSLFKNVRIQQLHRCGFLYNPLIIAFPLLFFSVSKPQSIDTHTKPTEIKPLKCNTEHSRTLTHGEGS